MNNLNDIEQELNKLANTEIKITLKDILEIIENNYISKDKIRELREIDNIDYLQFKLKELLGE